MEPVGAREKKGRLVLTDFFGFREAPFRITPDPRFRYAYAEHERILDQLLSAIDGGEPFVLLSGEHGSGKSAVVETMIERLEASGRAIFQRLHPGLAFDDLLRTFCEEAGISCDDEGRMESFGEYLAQQSDASRGVVFVFDEAQGLPAEVLSGLGRMACGDGDGPPLATILLIGPANLASTLDECAVEIGQGGASLKHCRLKGMAADDVGSYIRYRLQAAGHPGDRLFQPDAVAAIAVATKGLPRLVNLVCGTSLLICRLEAHSVVTLDISLQAARDCGLQAMEAEAKAAGMLAEAIPVPEPAITADTSATPQTDLPGEGWSTELSGSDDVVFIANRRPHRVATWVGGIAAALVVMVAGYGGYQIYQDNVDMLAWRPSQPIRASVPLDPKPDPLAQFETAAGPTRMETDAEPVVGVPKLTVATAVGRDGAPVLLPISVISQDGDVVVSIDKLPPGAMLSAGLPMGDGVWRLRADELAGLTLRLAVGSQPIIKAEVIAMAGNSRNGDIIYVRAPLVVVLTPSALPRIGSQEDGSEWPNFSTDELMKRGDAALKAAGLGSARLYYELAAARGSVQGAVAAGRSYDPLWLREFTDLANFADRARAIAWYQAAAETGNAEARTLLSTLGK